MEDNLNAWIVIILEGKGQRKVIDRSGATVSLLGDLRIVPKARRLATFRRKIEISGSTVNGLRPSKDRRAAGGDGRFDISLTPSHLDM